MPVDRHAARLRRRAGRSSRQERKAARKLVRRVEDPEPDQDRVARILLRLSPEPVGEIGKIDVGERRRQLPRQIESGDLLDGALRSESRIDGGLAGIGKIDAPSHGNVVRRAAMLRRGGNDQQRQERRACDESRDFELLRARACRDHARPDLESHGRAGGKKQEKQKSRRHQSQRRDDQTRVDEDGRRHPGPPVGSSPAGGGERDAGCQQGRHSREPQR